MLEALFATNVLLFTVPALLGSVVFLVKMGLMTLGGVADADADIDVDVDVDIADDVDVADSTHAFNLLSVQSIAAFLMGFGWGGMASFITFDWGLATSVVVGAGFGTLLVYVLGTLMSFVYRLQSSGNVRIADAIGLEGEVYATVPAHGEGRGQVRVVIGQRMRIYNAVNAGDEAIPTGGRIRVTAVNDDNSVTVAAT